MARRGRNGDDRYGLDQHGIEHVESATGTSPHPRSTRSRPPPRGPDRRSTGRWSCAPASTPAARRNDKFIVREPASEKNIWWGKVNQPFEQRAVRAAEARMLAYLRKAATSSCRTARRRRPALPPAVRVITETAWHSLFARNMFIRPAPARRARQRSSPSSR